MGGADFYLQGEPDNFEALLHGVELLFVEGVVDDVGPQFDVLVAQIPEPAKMEIRSREREMIQVEQQRWRWRLNLPGRFAVRELVVG